MAPTHNILALLTVLLLLLPLPIISSPSSTLQSSPVCPVALDLDLPASCPSVPDMTLKEYLDSGYCCLREHMNGKKNVDVRRCGKKHWVFKNDVCASCFCRHFSHFPQFPEKHQLLMRMMNDITQSKVDIPGAKLEHWVTVDRTQQILDLEGISVPSLSDTGKYQNEREPRSQEQTGDIGPLTGFLGLIFVIIVGLLLWHYRLRVHQPQPEHPPEPENQPEPQDPTSPPPKKKSRPPGSTTKTTKATKTKKTKKV